MMNEGEHMNITFLVGNGFDISAGIDTSYVSFYKWYQKQPSATECIKDFKENILTDIANGGKNWADFEMGLGKYTAHFTLENIDDFFECYEDAHTHMMQYLQERRNAFDSRFLLDNELNALKTGVRDFYAELSPQENTLFREMLEAYVSENKIINFVSFNYTNILDLCVERLAKEPLQTWTYGGGVRRFIVNSNVIHVHGNTTKYPILGVNDESQIANKELLADPHFCEIMLKPRSVDTIGEFWHRDTEKRVAESSIICVWGMSLGESDTKWWEKILSWLRGDSSRQLIIFWHTVEEVGTLSILKHSRAIETAKNNILKYSKLPAEETQKLASRIHIITNTDKVLRISLKEREATPAI